MLVNGNDARKYNAKQLTVELQPAQTTFEKEWEKSQLLPRDFGSSEDFGKLKLVMYFRGKDRNQIRRNVSEFVALFSGSAAEVRIDRFQGIYVCYITKSNIEDMIVNNRNKLTIECDYYMKDEKVEKELNRVTSAVIHGMGTRCAPCRLEIVPSETMASFVISGLGDQIKISNLKKGKKIIIDGIEGIASKEDSSMMQDIDLWEFPRIGIGENKLMFSNNKCDIKISYEPLWL